MNWYHINFQTGVQVYAKSNSPTDARSFIRRDLALHPYFRRANIDEAEITETGMDDEEIYSVFTSDEPPNIVIYQKGDALMKIRRPAIHSPDESSISVKYRE